MKKKILILASLAVVSVASFAASSAVLAMEEWAGISANSVENVGEGNDNDPSISLYIPYRDGVDPAKFVGAAQQLASLLEDRTGYQAEAIVPPGGSWESADATIDALQSGQADLALLNWLPYLVAHETAGAEAALMNIRFGQHYYESQLLTYAGSGVSKVADFEGRDLCWVDQFSTSGYFIPSLMLLAEDIDPDANAMYSGSHPNVVSDLYYENCEGGGTFVDARELVVGKLPDVYDVVIQVEISPRIPSESFSFGESFPKSSRNKVVKALLYISATPEGAELLGIITGSAEGFVKQKHSIYKGLERLIEDAGFTPQELWEN